MTEGFIQSVSIASFGLLASVLTASLSYYFIKKNQLKMEERRLKEEYYKLFIQALSDVALDNKNDHALKKLAEAFNSLLLSANAEVISELMRFHDFIRVSNQSIPRDSLEWSQKHDALLKDLIKAIRRDLLGFSDKYFPNIHLIGKQK